MDKKVKQGVVPNIFQVCQSGEALVNGMKYFTVSHAAKLVGRHPATIRAWIKRGVFTDTIDANTVSPRVLYLIPAVQVWRVINGGNNE